MQAEISSASGRRLIPLFADVTHACQKLAVAHLPRSVAFMGMSLAVPSTTIASRRGSKSKAR